MPPTKNGNTNGSVHAALTPLAVATIGLSSAAPVEVPAAPVAAAAMDSTAVVPALPTAEPEPEAEGGDQAKPGQSDDELKGLDEQAEPGGAGPSVAEQPVSEPPVSAETAVASNDLALDVSKPGSALAESAGPPTASDGAVPAEAESASAAAPTPAPADFSSGGAATPDLSELAGPAVEATAGSASTGSDADAKSGSLPDAAVATHEDADAALAAPSPDVDHTEVQVEQQFHAQEEQAKQGEISADQGLAHASEQEAAEVAAPAPVVAGPDSVAPESAGPVSVGAEPAPDAASQDSAPGPDTPVADTGAGPDETGGPPTGDASEVQAEASGAVEAAGEDTSGEGAADAAGAAGGGGGGGGESESSDATPPAAAPEITGEPAQAMAAAGALPPAQLVASLGSVSASASRAVGEQRAALAAQPPEVKRGAGAEPIAVTGAPPPPALTVTKAAEGSPKAFHVPKAIPNLPPAPVENVRTPQITETAGGKVSDDAARDVQGSVRALPIADPGLAITPGAPPKLPLAGDADPTHVQEQQGHLDDTAGQAAAQGRLEAAAPLGEDQIHPTVPAKTLRGEVGGAAGGGAPPTASGAAAAVGEAADSEAVSVVAQQEKGDEIRGAVAQGAAQISAAKQSHAEQSAKERSQSAQGVAELEKEHVQQQAAERTQAQAEVHAHRQQWTSEQSALVESHRAEASTVAAGARQTVVREQTQAETEAIAHHQTGEQEAGQARREGEQEAAQARKEGEKESSGGGFFSWAASAMKSLVDKVKGGIKSAFDKARSAVKSAIQKAQQLATAVIERARQAVVSAIKLAGSALIAIGDRLLAAFPGVRDKFRKAIQDRVKAAEAAVNRLAEGLERNVKKALDLLGKGLDAALGLLEKGMLAAVDAVRDTVKGALDFAKKAIEALGAFAVIAKDVAKGPGQWISKLAGAVVAGIKEHLWGSLKAAVKEWFNSKVEELTGFGQAVWSLLKKGGISLAQVGKMVWQGVVAAIPTALIMILVEKLVSMIVPAAGAVLAVIQGLQAAWGAVQRVIAAIAAFVAFLKGVLSAGGPVLFAKALAATAIAVIEFVAQWLLKKLKGAATGVGGKLREIAKRIGQRLKVIGKAIAGGAKKAAGAAIRAVKAVGRGIVGGAKAIGRGIAKGAKAIGKKLGPLGAAMARGVRGAAAAVKKQWERLKAKFAKWREKLKKKWEDWKKKGAERKKARQEKAFKSATESFNKLFSKGASKLQVKALALWLRIRHRFHEMKVAGDKNLTVDAGFSPGTIVGQANQQNVADIQKKNPDASVVLVSALQLRNVSMGSVMAPAERAELGRILRAALKASGRNPAEAKGMLDNLLQPPITIVTPTDAVRKYYETLYANRYRQLINTVGRVPTGQLHHWRPLWAGGDNTPENIVDIAAGEHTRLHSLLSAVNREMEGKLRLNARALQSRFSDQLGTSVAIVRPSGLIEFELLRYRNV